MGVIRTTLFGLAALVAAACGGDNGSSTTPTEGSRPPTSSATTQPLRSSSTLESRVAADGTIIKYNETNSIGIAEFNDSTTDQTVTVQVFDSSSTPLEGMKVQYIDSEDFEGFLVEDPNNQYAPSFRVNPYIEAPKITTGIITPNRYVAVTMQNSGPEIREISGSSAEAQAVDSLVQHAKNEWLDLGPRTIEQLDAENELYSIIVEGLTGINTSFLSNVAGTISDISELISGWHEPESYHVYEIVTENPITTTIRVLVPVEGGVELTPTPAPDVLKLSNGSKVPFSIYGPTSSRYIILVDILDQKKFVLTDTKYMDAYDPAISPDGRKLVFVSNKDDNYDLWLMDIASTRIAKLTDTTDPEFKPRWSQDGNRVVFRSSGDVVSIDFSDNCYTQITSTNLILGDQSFSPSGEEIIYSNSNSLGKPNIISINMGGNNPTTLAETVLIEASNTHKTFTDFDVSLDGKIAAVMQEESTTNNEKYNGVVIIENGDWLNPRKITWDEINPEASGLEGYHSPTWSNDGKFLFYQQDIAQSLPGIAWTGKNDPWLVFNPKTGDTMNVHEFRGDRLEDQLIEVDLGELLEGGEKSPYNSDCSGAITEEQLTLEETVKYIRNLRSNGIQLHFDGDREIRVRVTYDRDIATEYFIQKELERLEELSKYYKVDKTNVDVSEDGVKDGLSFSAYYHTSIHSEKISSEELKRNSNAIKWLETDVLGELKDMGATNVEIFYFQEGNKQYVK
jgi:dipeptidyl aminopeptidase/acylaminoacyl peptidase